MSAVSPEAKARKRISDAKYRKANYATIRAKQIERRRKADPRFARQGAV